MTLNLLQAVQLITVLLTGLLAGLFYGYSCSVINGLGNLQDIIYLQSFQSINKVIQNQYFFISFIGSLLMLPLSTWLSYKNFNPATFYLLLSATLIYVIAVFAVTIFGNVPLNNHLEKFNISNATTNEIAAMRKAFEKPWNLYHTIRTVAANISFSLAILSLVKQRL